MKDQLRQAYKSIRSGYLSMAQPDLDGVLNIFMSFLIGNNCVERFSDIHGKEIFELALNKVYLKYTFSTLLKELKCI